MNLKELFAYIGKEKFIRDFTDMNPTCGVQSRINGKGTNKTDKQTEPTDIEKQKIKDGLTKFIDCIVDIQNQL